MKKWTQAFGVFALTFFGITGVSAEPTEEVLFGIMLLDNELRVQVASGGCTTADDFDVQVAESSPYQVTLFRTNPDNCRRVMPEGELIVFDREKIGLGDRLVEFTITNKIGNTSNHR